MLFFLQFNIKLEERESCNKKKVAQTKTIKDINEDKLCIFNVGYTSFRFSARSQDLNVGAVPTVTLDLTDLTVRMDAAALCIVKE